MAYSARQILEAKWDGMLPVNVVAVARSVGVQVQPNASVQVVETWVSGTSRLIEYNPNELPVRQRFAIAHALAHIVLDHVRNGDRHKDTVANFSTKTKDANELAANRFAMQLLVPESTLRYAVLHRGMTTVTKLAETFGVSQVLMAERIQHANLT